MIPTRCLLGLVAICALLHATPATAQTTAAGAAHALGVRVYGIVETEHMLARRSFTAVLPADTKNHLHFAGAGGDVIGIYKGAFARFAVTHSANQGGRAFVDPSGQAYPVGVPLKIEITPIEIGGGWRFRLRFARVVPYAGGAMLLQRYKETSDFAAPGENIDTIDKGGAIFGGADIGFGIVTVGVEAQFRTVPSSVGAAGVSSQYDETNLGGAVLRLNVGVGF